MDGLFLPITKLVLDQFGLQGLLFVIFMLLWALELRRHDTTRKELATERSARTEDLKAVLPVIQSSTSASQSTASSMSTLTEAVRDLGVLIRELTLSNLHHGG